MVYSIEARAAQILRSVFAGGISTLHLWERVALMAALGVAYLMLGRVFYLRWEEEARRRGELSKY